MPKVTITSIWAHFQTVDSPEEDGNPTEIQQRLTFAHTWSSLGSIHQRLQGKGKCGNEMESVGSRVSGNQVHNEKSREKAGV